MTKLLACKCKDSGCDHWKIVLKDHHDTTTGEALEDAELVCVTCGETHDVTLQHHDTFITKEV